MRQQIKVVGRAVAELLKEAVAATKGATKATGAKVAVEAAAKGCGH